MPELVGQSQRSRVLNRGRVDDWSWQQTRFTCAPRDVLDLVSILEEGKDDIFGTFFFFSLRVVCPQKSIREPLFALNKPKSSLNRGVCTNPNCPYKRGLAALELQASVASAHSRVKSEQSTQIQNKPTSSKRLYKLPGIRSTHPVQVKCQECLVRSSTMCKE